MINYHLSLNAFIELSLIHQEIDLLRIENHNQNIQIAFLKEKAGLQDQPDHQSHQVSTDISENGKASAMIQTSSQRTSKGFHHHRQERPARLLPLQVLRRKNNTDNKISRFYGQPTNCSHLSQLGYTLNGFYLVKSANLLDTSGLQLETVFCSFKQPEGRPFNSSALEKRIGFFKLDDKPWETDDVDEESPISNYSSVSNNSGYKNSSGRIMFHLQIRNSSNNIVQITGSALNFDLILSNFENCYSPNDRTFLVPIDGRYKFVFEGKILAKNVQNITFRYSARYRPPDYKTGSTLESAQASDMTNNTVKLVTIQRLTKSSKAQLKTVNNPKGTFILSADNFTSFRAYLMP